MILASPVVAQAPPKVVPEFAHLPEAKMATLDGEKKATRKLKAAQSGSTGVVGLGIAGPSTSTSTRFTYSDARAKQIWELAQLHDYHGAHALFDKSEQFVLIDGKKKVQSWLNEHQKVKKRLEESSIKTPGQGPPHGLTRNALYLCGASAIWRPVRNAENLAAGTMLGYQITYDPCQDRAYATADNYKKHVYRYHLGKDIPAYHRKKGKSKEKKGKNEGEEQTKESAEGKGEAPEEAEVRQNQPEDYEG
jgi:hypothetical protein